MNQNKNLNLNRFIDCLQFNILRIEKDLKNIEKEDFLSEEIKNLEIKELENKLKEKIAQLKDFTEYRQSLTGGKKQ